LYDKTLKIGKKDPQKTGINGVHSSYYNLVEQDANVRTFKYFNKNVEGFYDTSSTDEYGWDFLDNPLDPIHTYSTYGTYWDYYSPHEMRRINHLVIGPDFRYFYMLFSNF
jgi:hypothetical protein